MNRNIGLEIITEEHRSWIEQATIKLGKVKPKYPSIQTKPKKDTKKPT